MNLDIIQSLVFGLCSGILCSWFFHFCYQFLIGQKKKSLASKEADRIIQRAKSKVSKIEREAKNQLKDYEKNLKRNAEKQVQKQKIELEKNFIEAEKQAQKALRDYKIKKSQTENQLTRLESKEKSLEEYQKQLAQLEQNLKKQTEEYRLRIEKVSQLSQKQAEDELKKSLEDEVYKNAQEKLEEIEKEYEKKAEHQSKMILATALSRYANEVATEKTVSIMSLKGDDLKGKIIGKEGRNIRALEANCGVDLVIDETPGSILISSFDPIRREIAQLTLQRLIEDGRIHPARIEEAASKAKQELNGMIKEHGEKACFDLGIHEVHPKIQYCLGTLKYKMSHTSNLYDQSLEIAHLSGLLAAELETSVSVAKRAGLFHAIGRAIDHRVDGSYSQVGSDFLKKFGEKQAVIQAVQVHDKDSKEALSVLDHVLQSAFRLSAYRPGAENLSKEKYIKRLRDLESIANSFDGVYSSYAIQAGKELRVLVRSEKITEDQSKMLVRDISRKIERELNYPGSIKISLIREMRIIEQAR